MSEIIPARAHFIWFGPALPWIYRLGVISAARLGGFEQVTIHHDDPALPERAPELVGEPRVTFSAMDAAAIFESCGAPAGPLQRLLDALRAPAARANVVRVALLAAHGGVYLDTDTLTLRSLSAMRARGGVFCGEERLSFPAGSRFSESPRAFAKGVLRTALRDVLRRSPDGFLAFDAIQHLYPTAPNNAVLGAVAGHPFLHELLARMVALAPAVRRVRFALGTKLLERAVREYAGRDLVVYSPGAFYPLGPEISRHYFRPTWTVAPGVVVGDETHVVHWYASVRTRATVRRASPQWVREHAARIPFCALAAQFL